MNKQMKRNDIAIIAIIILSMVNFGCHHHHEKNDLHEDACFEEHDEHEHHDETHIALTTYSARHELFAEADPFSVGNKSEIIAHLTCLSGFTPHPQGAAKVLFSVGANTQTLTIEKPTQPGIYEFTIKPTTTGQATLQFILENDTMTINNIGVFKDAHTATQEAQKYKIKNPNNVVFTKEKSWMVDFSVEPVRNVPFGQVIKTIAQVMPSQSDEQIITAQSAGIVSFMGREVVEGKAVTSGERLFRIESKGMADNNLQVRYETVKSEYNRAKSEYNRKQKLAEDKIVSQSELSAARADFERAQVEYDNLRRNFNGGSLIAAAPKKGFIKQLFVQNGEFVEAGRPLASVSQNKNLYIKAEVQPKYYSALANIQTASFRMPNSSDMYSLESLGGRVVSYGKAVNTEQPLLSVIFEVGNRGNLLPGIFLETYIKTKNTHNALTVPNESLIEEMGNYFVYVQLTPELFEKREVAIGSTDGCYTEIVKGLDGTERVVGKGAIIVKLTQTGGSLDPHAGHVH